jgi:hypothetical protein
VTYLELTNFIEGAETGDGIAEFLMLDAEHFNTQPRPLSRAIPLPTNGSAALISQGNHRRA